MEPACQLRSGVAAMASSSEAAAADYDALSAEEQRALKAQPLGPTLPESPHRAQADVALDPGAIPGVLLPHMRLPPADPTALPTAGPCIYEDHRSSAHRMDYASCMLGWRGRIPQPSKIGMVLFWTQPWRLFGRRRPRPCSIASWPCWTLKDKRRWPTSCDGAATLAKKNSRITLAFWVVMCW